MFENPPNAYSRIRGHGSSERAFFEEDTDNDNDIELVVKDDGIGVGNLDKKQGNNGFHYPGEDSYSNSKHHDLEGIEMERIDEDCKVEPSKTSTKDPLDINDVYHGGCCAYLCRSSKAIFLGSRLNILMIFTPFAFFSYNYGWPGEGATFLFSLLAIAPFAERLGFVTEQLASYTNDTLGGLLNASFGNATEMIVSLFALLKGRPNGSEHPEVYRRLVQVSLLGSVLSNLLLVLGSALMVGGRRYQVQTYTKVGTTTSMALLFLAAVSFLLPAVLENTEGMDKNMTQPILDMSRFVSVVLLALYGFFLYFQLITHRHLYEEEDDDDDEEDNVLGFWGSIFWVGVLTVFISFLSEYMVDAIEGTVKRWGVSELFIGAIIIPIVGNAAEHASALIFAYRNKLDITLGVAVGSAVQISIMALPFCVLLGWAIGCPLDLTFSIFEVLSFTLAVMVTAVSLQDGKAHWMIGTTLVFAYVIIAAGFWVQKSDLTSVLPNHLVEPSSP
mmetsp:Transcript_8571/g.11196  ORF Transcript_8571/g.11196 Transcript_8571/m.11196 type:complete len:501 (-) Transcript_8571:245-1747(-)|eukprot:CAMPEP_0204826628 /NCGR_PEP_ID=MMETSP1346-20131115/4271_1 /ASSEMBLY_ACC=CAM_ASM_000771 /TAXON_ID=215587 /ORGANISM="Aplanochytrium stocchinoi, Strain GSBS06" /LENGTH=500 /DNA_ID=CAMNT_0051954723 /DNA_START=263 /DNA_END=1765 /DNA_ORIENTATION=-